MEQNQLTCDCNKLGLLLHRRIFDILHQLFSKLHVYSQGTDHLMVDRCRQRSQQLTRFLFFLELFEWRDVSEVQDLTLLVIERNGNTLDNEGLISFVRITVFIFLTCEQSVRLDELFITRVACQSGLVLHDLLQRQQFTAIENRIFMTLTQDDLRLAYFAVECFAKFIESLNLFFGIIVKESLVCFKQWNKLFQLKLSLCFCSGFNCFCIGG